MNKFVIAVLCRRLFPYSMILIVISSSITDVYVFVVVCSWLSMMFLLWYILAMVIILSNKRIIVWHNRYKRFFCIALGERVEYDRSNRYTSCLMLCSFYITCKVFFLGLYKSFVWSHVTPCMVHSSAAWFLDVRS